MNEFYVGFKREIEPPKGGLLIDDEVPKVSGARRPRILCPLKHSFNPLHGIDYKEARALADLLYTISPQGENTLTVRNDEGCSERNGVREKWGRNRIYE